jgi:hypothetical protein
LTDWPVAVPALVEAEAEPELADGLAVAAPGWLECVGAVWCLAPPLEELAELLAELDAELAEPLGPLAEEVLAPRFTVTGE